MSTVEIRGLQQLESNLRNLGDRVARQAVGHPLDPADREPLSALGSAEPLARHRRGPLLSARCGRAEA